MKKASHLARRTLPAIAILALTGCGEPLRTVSVGVHELSLRVPQGWEYLDHGLEHVLRRGFSKIAVKDLGPGSVRGYVEEVETAMEICERGDVDIALERLRGLRVPRPSGASHEEHSEFIALWHELVRAHSSDDTDILEERYLDVLQVMEEFPEPALDEVAERALTRLDHDQRRDIAARERRRIAGFDAIVIDTWDRLSHQHRRRHAFLLNEGRLLVIWTQHGAFSDTRQAFELVVESLEMHAP